MSDLYVHHHLALAAAQEDNLLSLARWLVRNAAAVEAAGGPLFGDISMAGLWPPPAGIDCAAPGALPPLGYGPCAGIAPAGNEVWEDYCSRSFGSAGFDPFTHWLQAPEWRSTEPSAIGAALRIAYALDYGVPGNHAAISRGEAWTDYDTNGFMWDRLGMLPPGYTGGPLKPLFDWPDDRPSVPAVKAE